MRHPQISAPICICNHLWTQTSANICFVTMFADVSWLSVHRRKAAYSRICGLLRSQHALGLHLWLRKLPDISATFVVCIRHPQISAPICICNHLWTKTSANIFTCNLLRTGTSGPFESGNIYLCQTLSISLINSIMALQWRGYLDGHRRRYNH